MDDTAKYLEIKVNAFPVSEVFGSCDYDKMELAEEDGLLYGDSALQEKNKKKKKKHKGGLPSPRRILAFNTVELSKLDEQKAGMKANCVMRALSKSASFPSNADVEENCSFVEGSGDSEDSRECAMLSSSVEERSMLTRTSSFPLKSALRGGYEELGMGPRPKLQVTWAPTVYEPPCSTISHTLNKSSSKKDSKHGKKGKSDPQKRQGKKKHHKSKCDSGSNIVRSRLPCYDDGGKEPESTSQVEIRSGHQNLSTSGSPMLQPELQSEETDSSIVSCRSETCTSSDVADDVGISLDLESNIRSGGVRFSLESTCGGSLFEPERVACNFLYRQAM